MVCSHAIRHSAAPQVPTRYEEGIIEVVPHAKSRAQLVRHGGASSCAVKVMPMFYVLMSRCGTPSYPKSTRAVFERV